MVRFVMRTAILTALASSPVLVAWAQGEIPLDPTGLVRYLVPLGIGGALAALVFWYYRHDFLAERASHVERESILVQIVKDNTTAINHIAEAVARLAASRGSGSGSSG